MADQQSAPQPGSAEYDAAMAAKFEASQQPPEEKPPATTPEPAVKPDHVPEKFWDAEKGTVNYEAWAKSTAELEAKFTQQNQQPKAGEGENPEAAAAAAALADKGLDIQTFATEFAEKGELSSEAYEKLGKAGISKEIVDSFIAGQQALASQRDSIGIEAAGGKEQWDQMAKWATTSLSVSERQLFNQTVSQGTAEQIKFAVAGLRARFESSNGRDPALVGGDKGGAVVGFQSQQEMVAAMADPRYKNGDRAYHAEVQRKLDKSTFWNS